MPSRAERLAAWMATRFANATTAGSYYILPGFEEPIPNCFAYAVNVMDKAIRPSDWGSLAEDYSHEGYYHLEDDSLPLEDGDVEVYAKPSDLNRPLHAHRVTDAATETCQSKMGEDLVIQHHRNFLQCNRPNSTQTEYGNVVARFRYDAARYATWLEGELTTSTGRRLKRKDVAWTSSGRPVAKSKAAITKSGRVTKRGKKGTGKTRQVRSYTTSGMPNPRFVPRHPPPRPAGGFRRPPVRPIMGYFPPVKARRVAPPAARRPVAGVHR